MTYGEAVKRTLLTLLLVSGLTLPVAAVSPAAADESAPPADALAPFYGQALVWEPCTESECAWLTVPVDYDDPSSASIRLRVSRTVATGPSDSRQGSLVTNPGGPGVSGLNFASYLADVIDPTVTAEFDVVGFDTRGVGDSAPIVCLSGAQTTRWLRTDITPDTAAEQRTLMRRASALAQGCLTRSPEIARHVGSDDTVRDMDILRQALGDDRLTFLGFSYGTYLGTRYAELFPERVGRLVLDGAVDPSLDIMQISQGQSEGFQLAVTRFARDCSNRDSCPWAGPTRTVLAGLNTLLESLDQQPLPTDDPRPLVQSQGLSAVFYAMYSPSMWGLLRSALRQAVRGNGQGLAELASYAADQTGPNRYATNMASAFPAISCWDAPAAPGPSGLASAARRWSRSAAVPELARAMSWGNAPCSVWFGHSSVPPAPAQTSTTQPILIVGGTYDPATPYRWARSLNRQLSTSQLLTYRGDGHTAYAGASSCINGAVDDYLLTGAMPPEGKTCS